VADLAGGVVTTGKHMSAAYHAAPYSGADKHAEQIIAAVAGAMQPFAPGSGAHVVGHYDREIYGTLQIGLERDIAPIEIGREGDLAGPLFHLSGNANPNGDRGGFSRFPESPDKADNIFNDGGSPPLDIGGLAQPLTDTSLFVDVGYLKFGAAQINTNRPRFVHATLLMNFSFRVFAKS
jgi:hypothetical protein